MRKTIILLSALVIAAAMFSSCNELKKMVKNADQVDYKVNPNPLEMHAGKVPVNVTVNFPAKYFGKKVKLVISPVLKADDGSKEIKFDEQTVQGEKFQDNNPSISYADGGSFSFSDTVDYEDALRMSDLELRFQISNMSEHSANLVSVKIADGVITTPLLVDKGMTVDNDGATVGKMVTKTIPKPKTSPRDSVVEIFFGLQNATVKSSELNKKEMDSLFAFIAKTATDPSKEIKGLSISSYASPDGPLDLNENLVGKRGKNTQSAFEKALKRKKIEALAGKEVATMGTSTAEDWDGFKKLVEASDMEDKALILRVLSMYSDPVKREAEIKKLAAVYNDLRKDILPLLRRSRIKVSFQDKDRSESELISLGASNPTVLNQDELFFAATKESDDAKQVTLYKNYTNSYPNDWKGWNNMGAAQVKAGNMSDAKTSFEKVLSINSSNAAALNNLGVIALAEGDTDKAWEYFEKAEENGCQDPALGYNMGVILIKQGKYNEALTKFGTTATFNRALAETLAGDNETAVSTLNSMSSSDEAVFYYLKAVVAAKAGNEEDVFENLKVATSKDNSLKEYAANDLEFRKYFDKSDFKDIVE